MDKICVERCRPYPSVFSHYGNLVRRYCEGMRKSEDTDCKRISDVMTQNIKVLDNLTVSLTDSPTQSIYHELKFTDKPLTIALIPYLTGGSKNPPLANITDAGHMLVLCRSLDATQRYCDQFQPSGKDNFLIDSKLYDGDPLIFPRDISMHGFPVHLFPANASVRTLAFSTYESTQRFGAINSATGKVIRRACSVVLFVDIDPTEVLIDEPLENEPLYFFCSRV